MTSRRALLPVTVVAATALLAPALTIAPAAADSADAQSRGTRVGGWSTAPASLTVGQRFVERLRIAPHDQRRKYEVRWRKAGGRWVVRQKGRSTRSGAVKVRYRPPKVGRYAVKLRVRAAKKARGVVVRRAGPSLR